MGGAIARAHAGTRPKVRLGAIDRAPGNRTFPLKRVMSHSGAHSGKLCRQIIFVLKHTLYLPDADFIRWMQLSFLVCLFHSSLISLIFRPSSSEIHAILNVRLLKKLVFFDLCLSVFHSLGLGKYDAYL